MYNEVPPPPPETNEVPPPEAPQIDETVLNEVGNSDLSDKFAKSDESVEPKVGEGEELAQEEGGEKVGDEAKEADKESKKSEGKEATESRDRDAPEGEKSPEDKSESLGPRFEGTDDQKRDLENRYNKLTKTDAALGKESAENIAERGTTLISDTSESMNGHTGDCSLDGKIIRQNEKLEGKPEPIQVAHLAHEGIHAGRDPGTRPSIEEEYKAFKAEGDVWNELKGSESHEHWDEKSKEMAKRLDEISEEMGKSEHEAKAWIRGQYRDISEDPDHIGRSLYVRYGNPDGSETKSGMLL